MSRTAKFVLVLVALVLVYKFALQE